MKKTELFDKKELETLPFNYKYIAKIEGLPSREAYYSGFVPVRRIAIDMLGTAKHFTGHPTKFISKIYKLSPNNGTE